MISYVTHHCWTFSAQKPIKTLLKLVCVGLAMLPITSWALLPFENTGNLYVSMWTSDEIAVFSPEGMPVERFSAPGLDGPRGIAFNPANGEIWVASEFSNAIFIFDHTHQLLRRLDHPDFNEPVGVTFASIASVELAEQSVYISNSNGNEIMVFDQAGNLLRRFTGTAMNDPNCSAFMSDGSLFVANRLGGSMGTTGAVSAFDNGENFLFDFTTDGIASVMAVARDPNTLDTNTDDTVWVTSGAGDTGIYEFDPSGNLITRLLSADIDNGRAIVPQGIAFDGDGSFYVVSYLNEVLKFDNDGKFLMRFATGDGTSRSTAFQGCQDTQGGTCVPFGINSSTPMTSVSRAGGGGFAGWFLSGVVLLAGMRRWLKKSKPVN